MTDGRKYENGLSIFETNHLSIYAVVYELEEMAVVPIDEKDTAVNDDSSSKGGGGCDTGVSVLTLLGLVSMMVWAKRR